MLRFIPLPPIPLIHVKMPLGLLCHGDRPSAAIASLLSHHGQVQWLHGYRGDLQGVRELDSGGGDSAVGGTVSCGDGLGEVVLQVLLGLVVGQGQAWGGVVPGNIQETRGRNAGDFGKTRRRVPANHTLCSAAAPRLLLALV